MKKKKIKNKIGKFLLDETKSKLDIRDTVAETIKIIKQISILDSITYKSCLPPVRNQGKQGSCSAQASAAIKEFQEFKVLNKKHLSPQFLHNHRPFPNIKEGSTPRSTMRNLLYHGICTEKLYPYGKIERQHKISNKIKKQALKFKIKNYAKVMTVKGLKKALCYNGVSYLSVPVYNNSKYMWLKKKGQKKRGYHAMAVIGYNNKGFILKNSWGKSWNKTGYTIFPYKHWNLHSECFTAFDVKNNNKIPKNRFSSFFWTLKNFPKRITKRIVWRFKNK